MSTICILKSETGYDCAHVSIGTKNAFIKTWPENNTIWSVDRKNPNDARDYVKNAPLRRTVLEACNMVGEKPLPVNSPKWRQVFAKLRKINWKQSTDLGINRPNIHIKKHKSVSYCKTLNDGMLRGVAYFIDNWLDNIIGDKRWHPEREPYFLSGTAYNKLLNVQHIDNLETKCGSLIENIYSQIAANRYTHRRIPSCVNWRWEQRTILAPKNPSPEVCLERAIVKSTPNDKWCNQVPVASGYLNKDNDRGRHVDLVNKTHENVYDYEMIELKIKANNPLFATIEILCYGLLYIFARNNFKAFRFTKEQQPLLWANSIGLRVLAPKTYYPTEERKRGILQAIEKGISGALSKSIILEKAGTKMDFKYLSYPPKFDIELIKSFNKIEPEQCAAQINALLSNIDSLFP